MSDLVKYKGSPNNPEEKKGLIKWFREVFAPGAQEKIDQANRLAEAKVKQEEEKARGFALDNMEKELKIEKEFNEYLQKNPEAELIRNRANTLDQEKQENLKSYSREEVLITILKQIELIEKLGGKVEISVLELASKMYSELSSESKEMVQRTYIRSKDKLGLAFISTNHIPFDEDK